MNRYFKPRITAFMGRAQKGPKLEVYCAINDATGNRVEMNRYPAGEWFTITDYNESVQVNPGHVESLEEARRVYWKKQGGIPWLQLDIDYPNNK